MGANVSKSNNEVLTEICSTVINDIITTMKNRMTTQQKVKQTINVHIDEFNCEGGATIEAISDISGEATVILSQINADEVTNEIISKLENDLTNKLKQVNKDLNLGQVNFAENINSSIGEIKTGLLNKINHIQESEIIFKQDADQGVTVDIKKWTSKGKCNVTADSLMKQKIDLMIDQTSKVLIDNLLNNKAINKLLNDIDQENEGINIGILFFIGFILFIGFLIMIFGLVKSFTTTIGGALIFIGSIVLLYQIAFVKPGCIGPTWCEKDSLCNFLPWTPWGCNVDYDSVVKSEDSGDIEKKFKWKNSLLWGIIPIVLGIIIIIIGLSMDNDESSTQPIFIPLQNMYNPNMKNIIPQQNK